MEDAASFDDPYQHFTGVAAAYERLTLAGAKQHRLKALLLQQAKLEFYAELRD
jgi:hypothetical protein